MREIIDENCQKTIGKLRVDKHAAKKYMDNHFGKLS